MLDAIALGELLIDFATVDTDRDGYPTLAAHPGGAPGNFLAALHAYGCSGAMLGKVGADTFGDLLCATLAQAGIRTEGIVRDPSVFTTLAFVTFGPGGERAFSFARKPGADTQLRFDELDLSLLDEARLLADFGVRLAMVTCGPKGCLLQNAGAAVRVAAPRVLPVDTTGAGDIFGGSAVSRLLQLGRAPEALTEDELTAIGRFAATAASLSTQYPGGISAIVPEETVLRCMEG